MTKKGWICAIPLVLIACQKSPGAYEGEGMGNEPQPEYEGGVNGADQPERPDQPLQPDYPGTHGSPDPYGGQPGTDGLGTDGLGRAPGADQPMNRPDVPQAVQDLQKDVEQMRGAGELQHTDLAKSLRDFSKALQTLPGAGASLTDAVSRIDSYADRIEAAGSTSNMNMRWAKRALAEGLDALEGYAKEQDYTAMTDRFGDLRNQVDQINADAPFAQSKDGYVNALEQFTGLLTELGAPRTQPGTQ